MALSGNTVLEVRQAGSDTLCGGGFNPSNASPGTDYSQADAPVLSPSDLAMASTGTDLTSAAGGFTAAMKGNLIRIQSGTNFVQGYYEIVDVTNTNTAVLDRNATSGSNASSGQGYIGGALASPGQAAWIQANGGYTGGAALSMSTWIKKGAIAYAMSTTANAAGGRVNLTVGGAATLPRFWCGYGSTRGDGDRPTITGSTSNVAFNLAAAFWRVQDLIINGGGSAISGNNAGLVLVRVKASAQTSWGISSMGTGLLLGCEVTGSGASYGIQAQGHVVGCYSHDHVAANVNAFRTYTGGAMFLGCIADTTTLHGFTADGSSGYGNSYYKCIAYGCGGDGFVFDGNISGWALAANCHAENCTGEGYGTNGNPGNVMLLHSSGYNNAGGNYDATRIGAGVNGGSGVVWNFKTPSASPFINAASGDFRLNSAASGLLLLGTGYPADIPGLSALNSFDIGAYQTPGNSFDPYPSDAQVAEAIWTYARRTLTA